jgi:methionine sulfoxide reductase heme-binding subunit
MLRLMSASVSALIPWTDRAGRFSAFRAAVFAGVLAPALWLAIRAVSGLLGPRALTVAIHDSGDWAVRFLLLSLAITPLRNLARWPQVVGVRRMLGLAALGYVLLHLSLYVVDQAFDLAKVASEIVLRTYLTIGFVALLGLIALGVTSTDGMVRRLGAAAWSRLHGLTYLLAVLALVHFVLQRKLDITEPALMAGLFLWLMGWRGLNRFRLGDNVALLAGLAVAAGLATMALEAGYYSIRNNFPFDRILLANLDFELMIRPGWWVLAAGLAVAAAAPVLTRVRPSPSRGR